MMHLRDRNRGPGAGNRAQVLMAPAARRYWDYQALLVRNLDISSWKFNRQYIMWREICHNKHFPKADILAVEKNIV